MTKAERAVIEEAVGHMENAFENLDNEICDQTHIMARGDFAYAIGLLEALLEMPVEDNEKA